jgi:hypothetical protein
MKNHLFIGLGGQGGKTIAELQKVFVNRSADAQALKASGQQWDFLYIDSSKDVSNERKNWVYFGQNLKLKPSSFLYLKDDGEKINVRAMAQRPEVAPWIGDAGRLQEFLEGTQGIQGANQRRRLGRLLFARYADRIRKAICEDKITPMLPSGNQCAIHVFASLAGGTGSGGVVDLVTMLRTEFPNASVEGGFPIFLYLYVTDRNFEEAQVGYFHQNQSAALRDLNALCCGKLRPTLLGSSGGSTKFSGDEPITQIILSSQLNSKNQMLSLSQQHQIVAEASFERIFSYVSGNLDTLQQKAVTGEDKLASYAGEPLGNLLRSFRFGSVGMRRWEVPIDEVRELLARDLGVSCYRKLLFQNWSDSVGSVGEKLTSNIPGYSEVLAQLVAAIDAERITTSDLPSLIDALDTDFNRYFAGQKRDGFKDLDLASYEAELRQRYKTSLADRGVNQVFHELESRRTERLGRIRTQLHDILRRTWTRIDGGLGLAYVSDLLHLVQDKVRKVPSNGNNSAVNSDLLRRRMDKRKAEWLKITLLSRSLKQAPLALAHQNDVATLLREDLHNRASSEDRELLNAVSTTLGQLASEYQLAASRILEWCGESEKRRDQLHLDLTQLQAEPGPHQEKQVANKAELSLENLDAHLKDQRLEANLITNTCDELLQRSFLETLGNEQLPRLGHLSDEQKVQLRESADTVLFKRVEEIHAAVQHRTRRESVLSGSVLDIIQRRYAQDQGRFSNELLAFINSATCNVLIATSEIQPKSLRQDINMPSMPRTGLVIGLPNGNPFGPKLVDMVKPLMEAGNTAVRGVYFHDDSTQIRMLFVSYWMAARFATVVHNLETMYKDALSRDTEGDTAYFTNIDSGGENGQRPALLLPNPEELQETMNSILWLGTRIPAPKGRGYLIQESDGQVVLIQHTEDGIEPIIIGETINALHNAADIVTIYRVSDAVVSAASGLNESQLNDLREALRKEDSEQLETHGPASPRYAAWVRQRKQIHELLKR